MGFLASFMLSSRAFYLGTILVILCYAALACVRQWIKKEPGQLILLAQVTGLLIAAMLLYSATQQTLYPKSGRKDDITNTDFASRLATIKGEPGGERIASWKRTVKLIREYPLLGVGPGNWKTEVLKYSNQSNPDFIYHIRNHNDFLEVSAETGIVGGILYISVFVLLVFNFVIYFAKKENPGEGSKFLFIPAFGILFYSVDAFFNFPADRAEMAALFSVFAGLGIAF